MKPYRSMLFVPGHKPDWVDKAVASGTDAVILDLEDSVPIHEKADARATVAKSIEALAGAGENVGVWVRPNGWESGLAGLDLEQVVLPGLHGLLLPMVYTAADVARFDTLLTHFEIKNGLGVGSIELFPALETAQSMGSCEEIAAASPRVVSLFGATARDADVARSLGYQFTLEGLETLYIRSRIVLACRAAGLDHPIGGLWQDIRDIEGLRTFAEGNRKLGYRGFVAIHPSHIQHINEIFTPAPDQVAFYRGMIAAFEAAETAGHGAVTYEGQHIDYAHVKTARETVAFADSLGS
jgi:citrate lyase subunit beta / citryl-CoA lyase